VGKGRRVASLAERLGGDDDVPGTRSTFQESVEGGKRGGKGRGKGVVAAPAGGGVGAVESRPWSGSRSVGVSDDARMAVADVRLQRRRLGRVRGRPGPKKFWGRGKGGGKGVQRAGGGARMVQGSGSTLSSTRSTMAVKREKRRGELRATAVATGNGYLLSPKNSCRRFLRVSGTGGRGPMAIF